VLLGYALARAARVEFLLRGPAPTCRLAATFQLRGQKGTNKVRLVGRVGKKALQPGIYAVTLRIAGRHSEQPRHPVFVRVRSARDVRPTTQRRGQIAFAECASGPAETAFGASASPLGSGSSSQLASGAFQPPTERGSAPDHSSSEESRSRIIPHAVKFAAGVIANAGRDPLSLPTAILTSVVALSVLVFLGLAIRRRLLDTRITP
jgi:hypothetical protein